MTARLTGMPEEIAVDHFLLNIETDTDKSSPGQFISLKAGEGSDPLLRRPFSIFNHRGKTIQIVVQVVGKGTSLLSTALPGEMDIIGPLGKGFTIPENSSILLVGGGVGNAPLFYLLKILKERKNSVSYIYGSRSKEYIFLPDEYRKLADSFMVTTDDGSEGEQGLATEAVGKILSDGQFSRICTCGPAPMMKRLVELSLEIPIEVSVETYFGCGTGLCYGCVLDTEDGPKRICVDGPVLNGSIINWDVMHD